MDANKLTEIITRKNSDLENEAVYIAEKLIEEIIEFQNVIVAANLGITERQAALKKLEIKTINATKILGL